MLTLARPVSRARSMARQLFWLSVPLVLLIGLWAPLLAAPADQSQVQADARELDHVAEDVDEAVVTGSWGKARAEWHEFDELWEDVEDGFRAASREGYRAIEATMDDIASALRLDAPDAEQVRGLIATLRERIAPFAANQNAGSTEGPAEER